MYVELFLNSPNLRAEIVKTITFDNKVIVQEYIHGRNGNIVKIEQVVIFEINGEKINRITMVKKTPKLFFKLMKKDKVKVLLVSVS